MNDPTTLFHGGEDETAPVPVEVRGSERQRLNVTVLLVLSGGAAFLLGRMLWPFVTAIISALVLAVLAYPAHVRLRKRIPHGPAAAFLSTAILLVLVVLPLAALSVALFNSIQSHAGLVADHVTTFLEPGGRARAWLDRISGYLGTGGDGVEQTIRNQLEELGRFLAGRTVGILSGLGGGLVQAGVALFTLYYLLLDGRDLMTRVEEIIPLDDELTGTLMNRSREIIYATMYGNVVVAVAQGVTGGLAFWLLDVPGAVLWGSVIAVLGLVPVLGSPVVWGPAALFLFLQGEVVRSLLLVAAGTLIVSTVDNVLRATVVSGRAQLHPLVVFFSALGGILLFGVVGIFLGPVLFVLSLSIMEVTRLALDPEDESRRKGSGGGSATPPPRSARRGHT